MKKDFIFSIYMMVIQDLAEKVMIRNSRWPSYPYMVTRAPHAGANARLKLHLENSKSKKGHNFVKKTWRITSPTGMSSPFDSEQPL